MALMAEVADDYENALREVDRRGEPEHDREGGREHGRTRPAGCRAHPDHPTGVVADGARDVERAAPAGGAAAI